MKPVDQFLYWYTLGLSMILTINALLSIRSSSQLLALALLLPVPLYVALQGIKRLYLWRQWLLESNGYELPPTMVARPRFSLRTFLSQRQPLFVVTLFGYGLVLLMVVMKFLLLP